MRIVRGLLLAALLGTALAACGADEGDGGAGGRQAVETLRGEGFSSQANAKTIEGSQHPDRDAQFSYINAQATEHTTVHSRW